MSGFTIDLNSEMKEESCVVKLDLDCSAVSFGRVCLDGGMRRL